GWNMEEGTFGGWLKQDGDAVRSGEPLFTLESEKATEEIEGMDAGFLRIPADGPKPGARLAVGTVIGYVVTAVDEPLPTQTGTRETKAASPEPVASPSVRRLARERGIDLRRVKGSGPGGRIAAIDLTQSPQPAKVLDQPPSSPRARRAARELGIDWRTVPGTGKAGPRPGREVQGR